HQVGQIGAREAGRTTGDDGKVHVFRQWNFSRVYAENFLTPLDVRTSHDHTPIETAGTQQRGVEYVWTVRSGDKNHTFVGFKTIHFNQQGIQGLLAFVVPPAQACATVAPNRVNFIDEDNTR